MPMSCGTGTTLPQATCRRRLSASACPPTSTRAGIACGRSRPVRAGSWARSFSTRTRAATATRARVDPGPVVLAPGPHDGGGVAHDLAPLHAPERAPDRSADRAAEPVVAPAGRDARL